MVALSSGTSVANAPQSVRLIQAILAGKLSDSEGELHRLIDIRGANLVFLWEIGSVLPTTITLPPILLASLFVANDQGVVDIARLRDVLQELLP